MKRRTILGVAIVGVVVAVCWLAWIKLASPTHIALVNYQNFQVAKMIKSVDNRFIKVEPLTVDDFDELDDYDAVLIFGMGIRMTDKHRAILEKLKEKHVPVYSGSVTDPANNICSLDSVQSGLVAAYLNNGGSSNYRSLFNYIRKDLTGKNLFTGEIKPVAEISSDILFHLEEEQGYSTVKEFESYYKAKGFYKEGAPKVAVISGIAGPFDTNKEHLDSLIISLERANVNVYPFASVMKRLEFLQEIAPDAVVYMPHGRLLMGQGEKAVEWLKEKNIPLFCPLTLNTTNDSWMADKQGMSGGFMSQSIVMPELDGGIVPSALVAQFIDEDGLYLFKTIPHRLEQFTNTVVNYLKLKRTTNADKRIAIYYFKGPGSSSLVASGLEVVPSLYHFIRELQQEGYSVKNLPATAKEFEDVLMEQGPVFNSYAEGNISRYLQSGYPALVPAAEYDGWLKQTVLPEQYEELATKYGPAPGEYFTTSGDGVNCIAVTRIDFGNITLLPQPTQGTGENSFAAVHGSNPVPPHHYIASYLWAKNGFKADAMVHFGTHGSLEFIPGKQAALSSADWADRLVDDVPHFYLYTIADVGEGIIAKRRSYATLVSHLNPPFMESDLRNDVKALQDVIHKYLGTDGRDQALNLTIKKMALKMGLHRDLQLDSVPTTPYTDAEIEKIDNFAEELCNEKITAGQYTLGVPFEEKKILSSAELMCVDPIAYNLAALDKLKGRVTPGKIENKAYFNAHYRVPARDAVKKLLANPESGTHALLVSLGVSNEDIQKAKEIDGRMQPKMNRMMAAMMAKSGKNGDKKGGGHPAGVSKTGGMPDFVKKRPAEKKAEGESAGPKGPEGKAVPKEERDFANAVLALEATVANVNNYRVALKESPEMEMKAILSGLNGGYVVPSSGGDFIANPNTLPTGRNLYSINAEATPTAAAWEKGVSLAQALLSDYQNNHAGSYPEKVSFTLWSGSFIESEGATIAQILYLLGMEPVRDQFGRVLDVSLIAEEELKRPRIDVVVQTSGQFRDLAASRLMLLQKAIELAADAGDRGDNFVAKGKNSAERVLLEKGFSPKDARELSTTRIFGGMNGMSGTGIASMVEAGDRWEKEDEIARTYLNNMGAVYGNAKSWGDFKSGVFEAALQHTNVVVQPRQSNTWGALSLDHVYEFMGGLTLTVRNVTGEDPENYFNDLRNRYNVHVQDLKRLLGWSRVPLYLILPTLKNS